jgi:hypothetical protein
VREFNSYFAANIFIMQRFIQQWIKVSLISLATVAFLGCILRYKIAFPLPFINQKYLLHTHSHFAFTGWITQALMACLVGYLSKSSLTNPLISELFLAAALIMSIGVTCTVISQFKRIRYLNTSQKLFNY